MVMGRFEISLDKEGAAYLPGQEVTGKIHIWNDKPKNVKGIYVECQALAQVDIAKQENGTRMVPKRYGYGRRLQFYSQTVHFVSEEGYLNQRIMLMDRGNVSWQLIPGQHEYPFSFVLPYGIPSSFEGAHGNVRYTIGAVYLRPQKFNHECKAMFTVNSTMDLNAIPEATGAVHASDFKSVNTFCCKSHPITAKFSLDRTGYVSGETIFFNAEVKNMSGKEMRGSSVQLVEKTQFFASGQAKDHTKIIYESSRGKFKASEIWENHPITVPPLAPSDRMKLCHIIDLSYEIIFTVKIGRALSNLVASHPIVIGSVPLRSSYASPNEGRQLPASTHIHGKSVITTAVLENTNISQKKFHSNPAFNDENQELGEHF